jgi:hypothetical protein
MSVLAYPRIHFRGRCLVSPPTANNDDVVVNLDEANIRLEPELALMTDDDKARRWIMGGLTAISPINNRPHRYLRCAWNYFGDASVRFQRVVVCSTVGVDGRMHPHDPIVGQPIQLQGADKTHPVISDVDHSGVAVTQIFVGGIRLGDGHLGLSAIHNTRAYSRWIGWRNAATYQGEQNFVGAGATWQFAMPKDELHFDGEAQSPVLRDLSEAALRGRGIQVQFCFYLVEPMISDVALEKLFAAGFETPNPAEAYMVGTIGPWEDHELATSMIDRLLLPPTRGLPDGLPQVPLGPASARVQTGWDVVSLNLITTFPEANYDRPPTQKADLGPVRLGLIPPGAEQPIAISEPIPYDNETYRRTGGIVDVPYDPACAAPADIAAGTLVLLADRIEPPSDAAGPCPTRLAPPILSEADSVLTLETDNQALFLSKGERGTIHVLIRERGGPPTDDVTISLWEYQFGLSPAQPHLRAHSSLIRVDVGSPLSHRIKYHREETFHGGHTTPLAIHVEALHPGSLFLAFTMDGKAPWDGFPIGGTFYVGIRVLPDDDYSHVDPTERVTWEFMYKHVFRYYHLIYPAMSKIIPFNNQAAMEAAAPEIVKRTDPAIRDTTRYMPVTRDLSHGKRELIVEWADSL